MYPVFDYRYDQGRTGEAKPLMRRATMPFSQNWTFCRAFSLLNVGRVSTAGAPQNARARGLAVCAERSATRPLARAYGLGRRDAVAFPHYVTSSLGTACQLGDGL